jgi:lipoprotein-releasing system ATP-binding protein
VLRAVALEKTYAPLVAGGVGLRLFHDLSLEVAAGEMVAVVGESGAGKSSLLHLLAALDRPTAGEVWCGETNVTRLNARQAGEYRNREIGYVWQFHYLLPEFTAVENVAMPLLSRGERRGRRWPRRRGGWSGWGWGIAGSIGRASCRGASSSGCRLRAR